MNSNIEYGFKYPLSSSGLKTDAGDLYIHAADGANVIITGGLDLTNANIIGGSGIGDVSGSGPSTNNAIARWNGLTGKLIKNSNVFIYDDGTLEAPQINVSDISLSGTTLSTTAGNLIIDPAGKIEFTKECVLSNVSTDTVLYADVNKNIVSAPNSVLLVSIDQNLSQASKPTFTNVVLSATNANTYAYINNDKELTSAANGAILASINQNINIGADVEFGNIIGTIATNSQPNITSIGPLSELAVTGNTTLNNTTASTYLRVDNTKKIVSASNSDNLASINQDLSTTSNVTFGNISGTITTASQSNITSLGTLTGLTINGNLIYNNLTANTYLSLNASKVAVSAANSENLSTINQNLGTSYTVSFNQVNTPNISSAASRIQVDRHLNLGSNLLLKFRRDTTDDAHFAIERDTDSNDLRIILDSGLSGIGTDFGYYDNNNIQDQWTSVFRVNDDGVVSASTGYNIGPTTILRYNNSTTTINLGTGFNFIAGEVLRMPFVHNSGVTHGAANESEIRSGTYTPTLTNITNINNSSASSCQYMRVGNIVTVSGRVTIEATDVGTTTVDLSIPISSTFANPENCAGTAADGTNAASGSIEANTTLARLTFASPGNGTYNLQLHFTYVVL